MKKLILSLIFIGVCSSLNAAYTTTPTTRYRTPGAQYTARRTTRAAAATPCDATCKTPCADACDATCAKACDTDPVCTTPCRTLTCPKDGDTEEEECRAAKKEATEEKEEAGRKMKGVTRALAYAKAAHPTRSCGPTCKGKKCTTKGCPCNKPKPKPKPKPAKNADGDEDDKGCGCNKPSSKDGDDDKGSCCPSCGCKDVDDKGSCCPSCGCKNGEAAE